MRRRALSVLTWFSLALFALVLLAWARSYLPRDFHAVSDRGRLVLVFAEGEWAAIASPVDRQPAFDDIWRLAQRQAVDRYSALGFECLVRPVPRPANGSGNYGRFVMLAVPYGYLALVVGAATAWSLLLIDAGTT